MINCADIGDQHGSMLVNLGTMFVNEIIVEVTAKICMQGVEVWTNRTDIVERRKCLKLLTQPPIQGKARYVIEILELCHVILEDMLHMKRICKLFALNPFRS